MYERDILYKLLLGMFHQKKNTTTFKHTYIKSMQKLYDEVVKS
jgi:hypothetical protein